MHAPGDDDPRDDRALIAAHLEGDAAAFGVLFARHRDRLWAVALRTTGDPDEAADALQDALISAFRRAESYRGGAAVTTWLHRIVVNACLDRLRRAKVRRTSPLPDDPDASDTLGVPPAGASTDPEATAEQHDVRRLVSAALAQIAPDQRAALVLVDMEGYSVDEAARILDVAPGTVKSRCSRGRARLLPLLADLRASGNPEAGSRVPPETTAPSRTPEPHDVPPGGDRP